jgi:hypothetical protein
MPQDKTPTVGAGNARAQGIGNSVTGVMNILGQLSQKETQHKQDQLRDASVKVIQSQQAIDEATRQRDAAKASGDTNGMAAAQKIIDQNEAVRDGIFADPKVRKGLAKGFNISYTDPQSNDSEEHKAVMAGIKQAQTAQQKKQLIQQYKQQQNQTAGKSMGAAYAQQQPTSFQPNVEAQQKLQIEQTNRAASQIALKDYLTFKASMARANATLGAAGMRVMGASMLQQSQIQARQQAADTAWERTKERLKIQHADALDLIGAHFADAEKLVDYRSDSPIKLGDDMRKQISAYDKVATEAEQAINKLQLQRETYYHTSSGGLISGSKVDTAGVQQTDAQIQYMKQVQANALANKQAVSKSYDALRSRYGTGGEGGSSASDSSDDNDTGDYSDPSNYLGAPGSDDQP